MAKDYRRLPANIKARRERRRNCSGDRFALEYLTIIRYIRCMNDVCLFAHFDKDDKVDDYVFRYLDKIKELNFAIVFISTARIAAADLERLRRNCFDVILRDNAGLDFGSWSAGFAKHGSAIDGRLLLANDSVYGPIGSLASALERMTRERVDFYGLVESIEIAPHLQSWFLLFEQPVIRNPAFAAILSQPFSKMTKRQIIASGEVGLSRRLVDAGFRYRALYDIERAGLAARCIDASPMLFLWRELLCDTGVPFVKVDLLRDNALGIFEPAAILQLIERIDPSICGLIESHLARMNVGRSPAQADENGLWRSLRHKRSALLREGYRLHRENRRAAEVWNVVKLGPFIAVLRTVQVFRRLRYCGRGEA
jgi:lipopolysaccharide biosynthesis protein